MAVLRADLAVLGVSDALAGSSVVCPTRFHRFIVASAGPFLGFTRSSKVFPNHNPPRALPRLFGRSRREPRDLPPGALPPQERVAAYPLELPRAEVKHARAHAHTRARIRKLAGGKSTSFNIAKRQGQVREAQ